MSPQIAGFDFMGSFEPCDCTLTDTYNVANATSPDLSSAPGGLAQRRNTFEVGGRYQGDFGPAGLYAFASYIGSGVVNNSTGAERYDDISMFFGGVAVNFGGLRVGGAVMTGADNGDEVPKPVGGANEFAYIGGIQYTLGPATVGASYMNLKSAGALNAAGGALASQRREGGINVGGTYVLAPGLLLWLSADYGQRYQGGYDFVNGTYDSAYNNVTFRMVALGGMVRW
jgi:predicted porin